jgi:hypothetical protein
MEPFSVGDFTYATNGYLIVRVDRLQSWGETESAPNVARLNWDHDSIGLWIDPPQAEDISPEACKPCKGTGKLSVCPECHGHGEVEAETDFNTYECDCATCNGSGKVDGGSHLCDDCLGSGEYLETKVPWRDGGITMKALRLASALPGIQFSTYGTAEEVVRIKFDGGVGLLMPRRNIN